MSITKTLPTNDYLISLQKAIEMTTRYRQDKETVLAQEYKGQNILPNSETFNRAAIEKLLAETSCAAIRIYYGMDETLKSHAILVGVNELNEDILPSSSSNNLTGSDEPILEEGQRCPDICPPKSPLNT
jgi:hypothetical protein